MKNPNIFKSN